MVFSNMLTSHVTTLVNNTGVTSFARQMYQPQDQEELHSIMELAGFHSFDTSLN